MKICVFIKQVPDTVDVKIDSRTGNLDREGIESTTNPFDLNALEEAVRLKEKHGGSITVITMGPPQAEDILKKALAMGCDEAILLSDRAFGGADTLATGYTLAKAAEKIGDYDLLLFGRHAVDADTGQTGPIVASCLDIPQITFAKSIEVEGNAVICERMLEDCTEKVKVEMPALVTVCSEMNTPRYPTPIGIMKALKKPRMVWSNAELGADPERIGKNGSPSTVRGIYEPQFAATDCRIFDGNINELAAAIVDVMEEQHLL